MGGQGGVGGGREAVRGVEGGTGKPVNSMRNRVWHERGERRWAQGRAGIREGITGAEGFAGRLVRNKGL